MTTLTLPTDMQQRLIVAAAHQGTDAERLALEVLEEYLEDLEDIAAAQAVLARREAGEEKPIPWEEAGAMLDKRKKT